MSLFVKSKADLRQKDPAFPKACIDFFFYKKKFTENFNNVEKLAYAVIALSRSLSACSISEVDISLGRSWAYLPNLRLSASASLRNLPLFEGCVHTNK